MFNLSECGTSILRVVIGIIFLTLGVEGQINPEDVYREVIAKFKEGVIVIPEGKSGGTLEEITINVPVIKGVGTGVLSQNQK